MDSWQIMFDEANRIVQSAQTLEDAIQQIVASARNNTDVFDEPDYWERVEQHDFRKSFTAVMDWARAGLLELEEGEGCGYLYLDLGDCPESFYFYYLGGKQWNGEYNTEAEVIFSNSVHELDDAVLTWNRENTSCDFHGDNGYFLWLVFGSFALVTVLRDRLLRQIFLRGRERMEIYSGFEGLYFPLVRVTPAGVIHSTSALRDTIEWQTEKTGQLELDLSD